MYDASLKWLKIRKFYDLFSKILNKKKLYLSKHSYIIYIKINKL